MKTPPIVFLLIFLCCFSFQSYSQVPQGISYQAVARDSAGNLLATQNISLRLSIHDSTIAGPVVYQETHLAATNDLGLFSVYIGQGIPVTGIFADVNWGIASKFLQVELDATGGSNFTDMGTQQMMSVPYALFAGNSASVGSPTASQNSNNVNDTAYGVPDNSCTGATSSITLSGLPDSIPSNHVAVKITITVADPYEIAVCLIAPTGDTLLLVGYNETITYGDGSFINVVFSDYGNVPVNLGSPPYSGVFLPSPGVAVCDITPDVNSFGAIGGGTINPNGTWTLKVFDQGIYATAILNDWSVLIDGVGKIENSLPKWTSSATLSEKSNIYDEGNKIRIEGNLVVRELLFDSVPESDSTCIGSIFLIDVKKSALRAGYISDLNIGKYSAAFGLSSIASGNHSFAIGPFADASGPGSFAAGIYASADAEDSRAFGYFCQANGAYSTAIGYQATADTIFSTAIGHSTTASGEASTAIGHSTTASGEASTAIGSGTIAEGWISTAMGSSTLASGSRSTAMGRITTASGDFSTAMGAATEASGDYSTAMGTTTEASGASSTAMGNNTIASGASSTAMGNSTMASGTSSMATGGSTIASGMFSTAMGNETDALSFSEFVTGRFNTLYTPVSATGWNTNDRLFVIGNGTSSGLRSNAITVLKGGSTGIGVDIPTAKLDVNGTIKLGTNGSVLTNIMKATVNSDVANIAANSSLVHTFTVTNAVTGSTVHVSPAIALNDGVIISYARVSVANTVEVKFRNTTAAAINPAAMDYYISVIQ